MKNLKKRFILTAVLAILSGYQCFALAGSSRIDTQVMELGKTHEDYVTSGDEERLRLKGLLFLEAQGIIDQAQMEIIDRLTEKYDAPIEEAAKSSKAYGIDSSIGLATYGASVRTPTYTMLNVDRRQQENSYYCGPASTQMIQYYFNQACSQSYIASQEGTTSSNGTAVYRIVNFLNQSPMTGNKYLPTWWKWEALNVANSQSTFESKIQWAQYNYQAPQIFHLKTNPSGPWGLPGYTSNLGHYVSGYGFDYRNSSNKLIHYQDPYYREGGGTRSTSTTNMWNCIKANAGYMIY